MNRAAVAAAVLVLTACLDSLEPIDPVEPPAEPPSPTGSYEVAAIQGNPLPYTAVDEHGTPIITFLSGDLSIRSDGSFSGNILLRNLFTGEDEVISSSGDWRQVETRITFQPGLEMCSNQGLLEGRTILILRDCEWGLQFLYER